MLRLALFSATALLLAGCGQGIDPGDNLARQSIDNSAQSSSKSSAKKPDKKSNSNPDKVSWQGCKAYQTRSQAQQAWQGAGRPSSADRNDDGLVCSSLPVNSAAKSSGCQRQNSPISVTLSRSKYPQSAFHIEESLKMGQPPVLVIERTGTDQKRDAWARVVGDVQDLEEKSLDQDEYPMAMTSQKGGAGRDANIALINSSDNRGAGSTLGSQLRAWCDGQKFRIKTIGSYQQKVTITIIANDGRRINKTVSSG